jgi:hypothetical protein
MDMTMVNAAAAPRLSTEWQLATRRRRVAVLAVLTILASLGFARLVLQFDLTAVVFLLIAMVLVAIAWQPRVGLYVAFGLVLLFEAGGADPLMLPGRYLNWGLQSTLGLTGFIVSPLELLLLLAFGSWLVMSITTPGADFRGGRLFWPMLLFVIALVMGMARGALGEGDLTIGFWEVRALVALAISYFLATNMIRTRRHVGALTAIALVAISLSAVEGAYRRVALIDTGALGVAKEFAYAHDTVIFLGTLLLLVLAQLAFGAPHWQRVFGLLLVPVAIFTLLATERRAGYIAVLVAFLGFTLVFLVVHRKVCFLITLPLLVGFSIYLPLFWNNTGLMGQPARAVRSMSEPDPRDAASNLYRDLEKINVRATIHAEPLLGVGFGREFLFAVDLPSLAWWPFWHYEPHHNILWVWLKTGAIGFILFWVLMGTAVARAAFLVKTLRERETRVFALLSLGGIITTLVFCYVDLGLVDSRVTIFLGTVLGTLAVLDQVHE